MADRSTFSRIPGLRAQALGALLGAMNGLLKGFMNGYPPVYLPSLEKDPDAPFALTDTEAGYFASLVSLGAIVGSLMAGTVTSYFGRKWVMICNFIPYSLFWLFVIFPTPGHTTSLLIGRFLVGVCCIGIPVGGIYVGEITHPKYRGFFSTWNIIGQSIGNLIVYCLAYVLDWRGIAIFNALLPWLFVPSVLLVKESPVWLLMQGRTEESKKSLLWFRGGIETDATLKEFEEFRHQIEENFVKKHNRGMKAYRDLLRSKYRRPIALLCFVMICRQFNGMDAILAFQNDIFEEAGARIDPRLSTILMGVAILICYFLAGILSDRIGRKRTIVASTLLMAFSGALFGLQSHSMAHGIAPLDKQKWIPVVCLILYAAGYALGLGPAAYSLMGEILPAQIKNQASSLATAVNGIASFLTIMLYHPMEASLGHAGVFWFYSSICVAVALTLALTMHETKGRSLADIERIMTPAKSLKNPVFQIDQTVRNARDVDALKDPVFQIDQTVRNSREVDALKDPVFQIDQTVRNSREVDALKDSVFQIDQTVRNSRDVDALKDPVFQIDQTVRNSREVDALKDSVFQIDQATSSRDPEANSPVSEGLERKW